MAVYPLLMGCLSLAVWRESERGEERGGKRAENENYLFLCQSQLGGVLFLSLCRWLGEPFRLAVRLYRCRGGRGDRRDTHRMLSVRLARVAGSALALHAQGQACGDASVGKAQLSVLRNPYVWVLAFASAFMYISRYAVNGWGVLYLQEAKGYELASATQIISINALLGIIGTVFSGWLSDVAFRGNRYIPAVTAGVLEVIALVLFAFGGNALWVNILAMVLFGIAIGVLICDNTLIVLLPMS